MKKGPKAAAEAAQGRPKPKGEKVSSGTAQTPSLRHKNVPDAEEVHPKAVSVSTKPEVKPNNSKVDVYRFDGDEDEDDKEDKGTKTLAARNSSAKTLPRSSSTKKRHHEAREEEVEEEPRSDAKTPSSTGTGEKKAKGSNKIRRLEDPLKLTKAQSDMLAKERARSDAVDNFPLVIESCGPAPSRASLCDFL